MDKPAKNKPDDQHPILLVSDLRKSFGATEVLKGINVDIRQGEFLVLVGPSGCGKSTLLSCIGGLTEVTSGRVEIAGRDVTYSDPSRRDIAMVFQSYALFPNMTVAKNIGYGLDVRKVAADVKKQKINEVAELLKIEDLLDRYPAQLSGGQRQRVAMGRSLVRDPKLFLFDEPLSNLDAKLRVTMRTEIKRLHATLGATMIYVTHDQIEAMTLASKILVLKDGVVQQAGTPKEIYNTPVNTFVAGFMGAPSMNLFPALVTFDGTGANLEIARDTEAPLQLFHAAPPETLLAYAGKTVTIGLRPEALTDQTTTSEMMQIKECALNVVEPAGSDTFAVIRLAGQDVVARLHGDTEARAGQHQNICFDLKKISYFDPDTGMRI